MEGLRILRLSTPEVPPRVYVQTNIRNPIFFTLLSLTRKSEAVRDAAVNLACFVIEVKVEVASE